LPYQISVCGNVSQIKKSLTEEICTFSGIQRRRMSSLGMG
jgi:hypothetical protein